MTATTSTIDQVINILIEKKGLSWQEMMSLLENKSVFKKYCDVIIADVRVWLANLQYVGQEATAYLTIQICEKMKKDLDQCTENYKLMIEKERQSKENKK